MKKNGPAPLFIAACRSQGLPEPTPEYKFHPKRRWRIDYFFERGDKRVALEIEGGVWTRGRHTRGAGFVGDMEKYNALTTAGIALIRVQPRELISAKTFHLLQTALEHN